MGDEFPVTTRGMAWSAEASEDMGWQRRDRCRRRALEGGGSPCKGKGTTQADGPCSFMWGVPVIHQVDLSIVDMKK